jgi:hypothetical protein
VAWVVAGEIASGAALVGAAEGGSGAGLVIAGGASGTAGAIHPESEFPSTG